HQTSYTPSAARLLLFTAPATTHTYTLSLHDALPICNLGARKISRPTPPILLGRPSVHRLAREPDTGTEHRRDHPRVGAFHVARRSEEHTSELQSLAYLVCRLLLEKKKLMLAAYTTGH